MAYYSIEKKLKTAEIGTILPWAGDATSSLRGWEQTSRTGIPDGWIICDGRQETATNYPLLAQALGTTYGGSITGSFPNYNPADVFNIPNIQSRHLADYDTSYLPNDAEVQAAITPLMGANTDNSVDNTPSLSANVNFAVAASNTLVGKTTGLNLEDPTYFKLFYTVNRKLGQNHTPSHSHGGDYESVVFDGGPAELFQRGSPNFESNGQRVLGWRGTGDEVSSVDFLGVVPLNGAQYVALQNDCSVFDQRLIQTAQTRCGGLGDGCADYWLFNVADEGQLRYSIVDNAGTSHVFTDGPKTFSTTAVANQPMDTGYIPLKANTYPFTRAGTGFAKNWSNLNPLGPDVTFATTMNHNFDQWANNDLPSGHNHGGFEVTMNKAGLRPPKTVYHNDVSTHNITPQNVPNALTMNINADTPSINILYIIRAF